MRTRLILEGASLAAGVVTLALLPAIPVLSAIGDKTQHVLAFAVLAIWLNRRAGLGALATFLALLLFAAAIEGAQALGSVRVASVVDFAASLCGAGAGLAAGLARSPPRWAAASIAVLALSIGVERAVHDLRPAVAGLLLDRAWAGGQSAGTAMAPWPLAPAKVAMTLSLPSSPKPIVVLDQATPRAMAIAPGLWPGRSPGEPGVAIVIGHRNGAFRALGGLREGDIVELATASGDQRQYQVDRLDIVLWNKSGLRRGEPGESLALVTCWPTDGTAPSPWRLIVRAKAVPTGPVLAQNGPAE